MNSKRTKTLKKVSKDPIEKQIRAIINSLKDDICPSIKELSKYLQCDIHTVAEAYQKLAIENIIIVKRGRKTVKNSREHQYTSLKISVPTGEEQLFRDLESEILRGGISKNTPLPKRAFYCVKHQISDHTVSRVYRKLVEKKLVWVQGKKWIAGQPSNHDVPHMTSIAIIEPSFNYWASLMTPGTARFAIRFQSEAEQFGCILHHYSLKAGPFGFSHYVTTEAKVLKELHEKKDQIRGILLLGKELQYAGAHKFLNAMKSIKLPIAWFDPSGSISISSPIFNSFFRCSFSEKFLCHEAIEYLAQKGHRSFGYLEYSDESWSKLRYKLLTEVAEKKGIKIISTSMGWNQWNTMKIGEKRKWITSNLDSSGTIHGKILKYIQLMLNPENCRLLGISTKNNPIDLLETFMSNHEKIELAKVPGFWNIYFLLPLLLSPELSCLLIPRDLFLRKILTSLNKMSLSVPEEISLLSFDNRSEEAMAPVDSVDPGMDQIGFTAIHHILKVLPDMGQKIFFSKPKIQVRGTVSLQSNI